MIIILVLIVISLLIILTNWKNAPDNGINAAIVCSVILFIICGIFIGDSYHNYLNDRAFYTATKEQYQSAIEIYTDYALIDMGTAALTDLKYQGYQNNISSFITSLRNQIIRYNTSIVKKRVAGKNPIISWFVVEPDDDMLIIKMKKPNSTSQ